MKIKDLPQPIDTDACKDKHGKSVIDNFKNRSEVGIFKYGTTLERQDLNVHDWLIHLQEELMDAVLYIERLKSEELLTKYKEEQCKKTID